MRKLAFLVVGLAALTGGFAGCGGGSTRKPGATAGSGGAGTTGSAGTTGVAGTTGAAGTGEAGTTGAAGTGAAGTGAAGTGAAGTGAAGTGAAGTGAAGTGDPIVLYCDMPGMTKKPLPYDIGADFQEIRLLNNNNLFVPVANPDCDQTTFPPFPKPDAGADAGSDAATEAGTEAGAEAGTDGGADAEETLTLQLDDPDAGDGGVADAAADKPADAAADAPVDAPVDAPAGDGAVADAAVDGPKSPACMAFTYAPDICVANNGGVPAAAIGACWSGLILQPTGNTAGATGPGVCIGEGALRVKFQARANVDGQIIKFGSTREGMGSTEFYLTLTTQWKDYEVAIPAGEPYNQSATPGGVWNGFSIVGEPQQNIGGTYLFVRKVTWSQ